MADCVRAGRQLTLQHVQGKLHGLGKHNATVPRLSSAKCRSHWSRRRAAVMASPARAASPCSSYGHDRHPIRP